MENPEANVWDAEEYLFANKDLRLMMESWDDNFQMIFAEGFTYYLDGNWTEAKKKFFEAQKLNPSNF